MTFLAKTVICNDSCCGDDKKDKKDEKKEGCSGCPGCGGDDK